MPTYTKTIGGQTVTWTGGGNYVVTREGALLIHAPGASLSTPALVVTAYTPAWDGVLIKNGAIKNVPGNQGQPYYGLDFEMNPGGNRNIVPVTLQAGDVYVIAKSHVGGGNPAWATTGYNDATSRSCIENMLVVVALSYDPTGHHPSDDAVTLSALLTPPVLGNNATVRLLRSLPQRESDIDMDRLPATVVMNDMATALGTTPPTVEDLTRIFAGFCGELYSDWGTDTATPGLEHPGYGSYMAGYVSQGLLLLCSDLPAEDKAPLAIAMVQWGIHLAGAYLDGRRVQALGGHCKGRKALIVLAGHLLHQELVANPDQYFALLQPGLASPFNENGQYFSIDWWFNSGAANDFTSGWRYASVNSSPNTDGSKLALPPSQWGNPNAPSWAYVFSYFGQTVGADIGTALAMQLLGRSEEWSLDGTQVVRQFMQGPPAAAEAELQTAGISVPWGQDYSIGPAVLQFCAKAWLAYGQ